jgi:hypothetical protein
MATVAPLTTMSCPSNEVSASVMSALVVNVVAEAEARPTASASIAPRILRRVVMVVVFMMVSTR